MTSGIIMRCLITAEFPAAWKISTTTPIPKKGNTKLMTNLRSISIIQLPGKFPENIFNFRLTRYLENNN